jgi:hypothetical protein
VASHLHPTDIVISDYGWRNVDFLDFPYAVLLDEPVPEDVELSGNNA